MFLVSLRPAHSAARPGWWGPAGGGQGAGGQPVAPVPGRARAQAAGSIPGGEGGGGLVFLSHIIFLQKIKLKICTQDSSKKPFRTTKPPAGAAGAGESLAQTPPWREALRSLRGEGSHRPGQTG